MTADLWIPDGVAPDLVDVVCDIAWPEGPYIPHEPTPRQHAFLACDQVLEVLYGGAAGGGKSDAMLMAALQYVDVPNYSAIIMRRTFSELSLEGALLQRAMQWLGATDATWNANDMRWRFPSGAALQFGYMKNDQDRARYQSAEFQFIGIDEVTDWGESAYKFMFSRLRRVEGVQVPLRMRSATNPGGRGHVWVKDRFVDRSDGVGPESRVFIPAKLTDNPYLDQESYLKSLEQLDPETKAMLLEGDWEARAEGEWVIGDPAWVEYIEAWGEEIWNGGRPMPPLNRRLSNCIDWGEITQGYVLWELPNGGIFIPPSEVVGEHEDPALVSGRLLERVLHFGWPYTEARYDAAGIQSMRTYLGIARRYPGLGQLKSTKIPFNKYKRDSMGYIRHLARRVAEGYDTRILAIHPDNTELCRQLRVWERKGPETDETTKEDDHGPDALCAGVAPVAALNRSFIEQLRTSSYGDQETYDRSPAQVMAEYGVSEEEALKMLANSSRN